METGSVTKCMDSASSLGLTVVDMKDNTLMTRKKDTEFSHGQTIESTMGIGSMENKKAWAYIIIKKMRLDMESGKMVKGLNG
jgi:hypothetical protein